MSIVVLDYGRIPSTVCIWLPTDGERRIIEANPNKGWRYWVRFGHLSLEGYDADGLIQLLGAVESEKKREVSEKHYRILSDRQRRRVVAQIKEIADMLGSPHEVRIQVNKGNEKFAVHEPSGDMLVDSIGTLQKLAPILLKLSEQSSIPSLP
jgi:hypothetical protein